MVLGVKTHIRKIIPGMIISIIGFFILFFGGMFYIIEEIGFHDHSGSALGVGFPLGTSGLIVGGCILAIGLGLFFKGLSKFLHRYDSPKTIKYAEGRPGVLEDPMAPGSEGAKHRCPRCGEILLETMRTCPSCGNPVR